MIPVKPANVTWTDEQWEAIYEDHRNIIVSAGAGSGKTAVLTERVIRKLKDGVNVNELLILTFTKAAAGEMADRIRKKIKKIPELKEQLDLLDGAYITTFDSFALSVVKKYHYLLNVSSDIGIMDSSVMALEKRRVMDTLFLEYYEKKDPAFLEMISSYCTKDDTDIQNYLLTISDKLDLLSNKKEFLEGYLAKYFDDKKMRSDIDRYFQLIVLKLDLIREKLEEIYQLDGEYASLLEESLKNLLSVSSYDALVSCLNVKMPNAPRGSDEALKKAKGEIAEVIKELQKNARYESEEQIYSCIKSIYPVVSVMIQLILEFTKRVMDYKRKNHSYEFHDIAIMAIELVRDHAEVACELRDSFQEIMIDEYQDTNDLQEEFIAMISDHNVYMVGDIKQSIYRFRNANPYIFKNKYDSYSCSHRDLKIDLNKNFRSRMEVLDNINMIFTLIMDDAIGGADYLASHQMIFGNQAYLKEDSGDSHDMEIVQYAYDKNLGYTKEEIEAFYIARDIIDKFKNHYQVFDKDEGVLRDIRYEDFSIIMDRATSFDLYKKIFNYCGIPLTLLKDEKMNDEEDILVLKNLLCFLIKMKENEFDTEFRYLFVSLMRSFLIETEDGVIFDIYKRNAFGESILYQKCLPLVSKLDYMTPHQLLDEIVVCFDYYSCYLKLGNIHNGIVKFSKLRELAVSLEDLGYDVISFTNYLTELLEMGYKMEYKVPDHGADAVRMMTIHKSKGLEYPICYFSGLYKEFNISDLKEKFMYDKDEGILVPYFEEGIGETIYKDLVRERYLKEEISEKIRLFYVALTRAREKMILVMPVPSKEWENSQVTVLADMVKSNYRTLADMVNSILFRVGTYCKMISWEKLQLTKDYALLKGGDYQNFLNGSGEKIQVQEISVSSKVRGKQSFSKKNDHLITKNQQEMMQLGSQLHAYLEFMDFRDPDYSKIEDQMVVDVIQRFLDQELMKNIKEGSIYREYEFIYEESGEEYHGVIDLMVEYEDHIDIIDYKLKNVDDSAYREQLMGYYDYIHKKSMKRIDLYLYSLLEGRFEKLK